MIGKVVSFIIGLAAASAAAAVVVVSAAFAFYALLRTWLGPAGAAACETLAAAVVLGLLAMFLFSRVKGRKPKDRKGPAGPAERLAELFSDRPMVAASAALAAGLLAWRNPAVISTLLRVMESRADKRRG